MAGLKTRRLENVVWAGFCVNLSFYVIGSFFPHLRLWGINLWAHFSSYTLWISLGLIGLIGSVLTWKLPATRDDRVTGAGNRWYLYFGVVTTLLLLAVFYIFRSQLHFLGDGYTLLANIAKDAPILKLRNFGMTLIHQLAYSLLRGENSERALLAYQIVSWLGGLTFVLLTLLFTRSLFRQTVDRVLFAVGMLSGGYMLLFFGYVEHYSLFVPSVAWFGLTGLLISKGRISRWYILPPLLTAIFMHIFGLLLVPSAVYLLAADTKLSDLWMKLERRARLALIVISAALAAVVFYRMYTTDYFFRLALVPIVQDRFTLEGYTMFSGAHLADIGNLVIMLFPGIVLTATVLFFLPVRKIFAQRDFLFLLLLLLSSLAAVLLFDPKLGMPRDWDLFSFIGVPLVILGYYILVEAKNQKKIGSTVIVLSALLGFFALVPRVAGQARADIGLAQALDYSRIDAKKSLILVQMIGEYYKERGELESSPLAFFDWEHRYPEWGLTSAGLELRKQRQYERAVGLFKQAIRHNPMYPPAYCNLGSAYLELSRVDEAMEILRIANGLRPYHAPTLRDLGHAYLWAGQKAEAEDCWKRALDIDPTFVSVGLNLLDLYAARGDEKDYIEYLMRIAENEDAPASVYKRLGDYYVRQHSYDKAAAEYERSVAHGFPREQLEEIYRRYPMLPPSH